VKVWFMVSNICVYHKKTIHNCPKKLVIQKTCNSKNIFLLVKYEIYWTIYNAKHTFFEVCSCVMGIETYGFVIENVDINIYIGFLEVFMCFGNWSLWYFNNKIWTIASRYKLSIWVAMVIWYNKSRWIYLQLAISLSSFLEPELRRQCIFLGSHNNKRISICGLMCVNISFFFLGSSPIRA
jgi:hypothetical protein